MIVEIRRGSDGQPLDGVHDGVEYVYGVALDQKLVEQLMYMEGLFSSLKHISRPRNAVDTTDEWLAIFCDLEQTIGTIRRMLGDQTDLYSEWAKGDELLAALEDCLKLNDIAPKAMFDSIHGRAREVIAKAKGGE